MDPKNLRYTKTHEWAANTDGTVRVGITQFAVDLLTDLTHVELPQVGKQVKAGVPCGEIESVKAVSDIYAPVDGEIIAVNHDAAANPGLITTDPYNQGWLFQIKPAPENNLDHLMDLGQYEQSVRDGH